MINDWYRSLGTISVMVIISGNIPQIMQIWKTKKTNDISRNGLIIKIFGKILILVYAFIFGLWELFAPNVISLFLTIILFVMKIMYHTDEEMLIEIE